MAEFVVFCVRWKRGVLKLLACLWMKRWPQLNGVVIRVVCVCWICCVSWISIFYLWNLCYPTGGARLQDRTRKYMLFIFDYHDFGVISQLWYKMIRHYILISLKILDLFEMENFNCSVIILFHRNRKNSIGSRVFIMCKADQTSNPMYMMKKLRN